MENDTLIDRKISTININDDFSNQNNQNNVIENNWDSKTFKTAKEWKNTLEKQSFIFQSVLDKYKKSLNRCMFILFFVDTIITISSGISATSLTNNDEIYRKISLSLNILLFILGGINIFVNKYVEFKKYHEFIESLSSYILKIDNFDGTVSNILLLPPNIREDGIEFLKKENKNFLELINSSPNISNEDYSNGFKEYNLFLKDNNICNQYFLKSEIV